MEKKTKKLVNKKPVVKEVKSEEKKMNAKPISSKVTFFNRLKFLFNSKKLVLDIEFFNPLVNKNVKTRQPMYFGNEKELNKKKYV